MLTRIPPMLTRMFPHVDTNSHDLLAGWHQNLCNQFRTELVIEGFFEHPSSNNAHQISHLSSIVEAHQISLRDVLPVVGHPCHVQTEEVFEAGQFIDRLWAEVPVLQRRMVSLPLVAHRHIVGEAEPRLSSPLSDRGRTGRSPGPQIGTSVQTFSGFVVSQAPEERFVGVGSSNQILQTRREFLAEFRFVDDHARQADQVPTTVPRSHRS